MTPAEKKEQRELERMIKQVKQRKREKDLFGEFEGAQAASLLSTYIPMYVCTYKR